MLKGFSMNGHDPNRVVHEEIHIIEKNEDRIYVFTEKPTKRTPSRLVLHLIGQILLWPLSLALGGDSIVYGTLGVYHQQIYYVSRSGRKMFYGDEAISLGVFHIAFGLWYVGEIFTLNTQRAYFKYIGRIAAIITGGISFWFLIRRFI